jgi:hypothetical protein
MNRNPGTSSPVEELSAPAPGRRELFVDVRNSQANIVEVVHAGNGGGRVRRLREQRFTQAQRNEMERLKRQIIYGENGGSLDLSGLYQPRSDHSGAALGRLVAELERRAGAEAWDRRRYPR